MTRALQDSLARANIKIQHGHNAWQHGSIGSIDTQLGRDLKRKRLDTTTDFYSDSASSVSGSVFSNQMPLSSPLSGPIFSDELVRSGNSQGSTKRHRNVNPNYIHPSQTQHRSKPRQARPSKGTWKTDYSLAESSPIRPHQRSSLNYINQPSFTSDTSTIIDSASASEDDDQDLPIHSFQTFPDTSHIPSSPPRTPSPSLSRSARLSGKTFSPLEKYSNGGQEGADLLLYLASSPSPAMHVTRSSPQMAPPSTPPSKHTPLPSSMMSPPGNHNVFAFNTPGANFNFADYCNVTPSPAQKRWGSTPKAKTPMTGSARRRENLMPPPSAASPNPLRKPETGLGMEFGGHLMK